MGIYLNIKLNFNQLSWKTFKDFYIYINKCYVFVSNFNYKDVQRCVFNRLSDLIDLKQSIMKNNYNLNDKESGVNNFSIIIYRYILSTKCLNYFQWIKKIVIYIYTHDIYIKTCYK